MVLFRRAFLRKPQTRGFRSVRSWTCMCGWEQECGPGCASQTKAEGHPTSGPAVLRVAGLPHWTPISCSSFKTDSLHVLSSQFNSFVSQCWPCQRSENVGCWRCGRKSSLYLLMLNCAEGQHSVMVICDDHHNRLIRLPSVRVLLCHPNNYPNCGSSHPLECDVFRLQILWNQLSFINWNSFLFQYS